MCVFRLLLSDFKFIHWLSLHSGTTPNREPYRIPELTESGRPHSPAAWRWEVVAALVQAPGGATLTSAPASRIAFLVSAQSTAFLMSGLWTFGACRRFSDPH